MYFHYIALVLLACIALASAHPDFYNCDGANWAVGAPFGHMNTPYMLSPHSSVFVGEEDEIEEVYINLCEILVDGSNETVTSYNAGQEYEITVRSHYQRGHKLSVEEGWLESLETDSVLALVGRQTDQCRYYSFRALESKFKWIAPAKWTGATTLHAICGCQDGKDCMGLWAADKYELEEFVIIDPNATPTASPSMTPSPVIVVPSASPSPNAGSSIQVSRLATGLSIAGAMFLAMVL